MSYSTDDIQGHASAQDPSEQHISLVTGQSPWLPDPTQPWHMPLEQMGLIGSAGSSRSVASIHEPVGIFVVIVHLAKIDGLRNNVSRLWKEKGQKFVKQNIDVYKKSNLHDKIKRLYITSHFAASPSATQDGIVPFSLQGFGSQGSVFGKASQVQLRNCNYS